MILTHGEVTQVQPQGETVIMRPGDITFAPPKVPHGSYNANGFPCEWYLIYFHPSVFVGESSSLFRPANECVKLMDGQAEHDFFLVRSVENLEPLLELLKGMLKESIHQWNNQQDQLQLLLAQWFHWLMRDHRFSHLNLVKREPHPHTRWIEDSLRYMQIHFGRPDLSTQELMDRVPMSRSQFFQVFKREVGKTFSEHLNGIRLKEASRLLRDTNLSITEILFRVGYQNPSHFGHRFKKLFGHAPRDHRRLSLQN